MALCLVVKYFVEVDGYGDVPGRIDQFPGKTMMLVMQDPDYLIQQKKKLR